MKAAASYKNVRVIAVDAVIYNSCGASSTQELAFALSQGSEYLSRLSDMGIDVETIARKMSWRTTAAPRATLR